jgi:hypothetical protein
MIPVAHEAHNALLTSSQPQELALHRLETIPHELFLLHYDEYMNAHVIANPVPTPEEMGRILGLSPERVAAVRSIMNTSPSRKISRNKSTSTYSFKWKQGTARTPSKGSGKR